MQGFHRPGPRSPHLLAPARQCFSLLIVLSTKDLSSPGSYPVGTLVKHAFVASTRSQRLLCSPRLVPVHTCMPRHAFTPPPANRKKKRVRGLQRPAAARLAAALAFLRALRCSLSSCCSASVRGAPGTTAGAVRATAFVAPAAGVPSTLMRFTSPVERATCSGVARPARLPAARRPCRLPASHAASGSRGARTSGSASIWPPGRCADPRGARRRSTPAKVWAALQRVDHAAPNATGRASPRGRGRRCPRRAAWPPRDARPPRRPARCCAKPAPAAGGPPARRTASGNSPPRPPRPSQRPPPPGCRRRNCLARPEAWLLRAGPRARSGSCSRAHARLPCMQMASRASFSPSVRAGRTGPPARRAAPSRAASGAMPCL